MKQASPIHTTTAISIKPEWKAMLKRLHLDYIKAKSPGFFELSGGYEMKIKPYSDTTANGSIRWSRSNTRKGIADVRGTYRGRSLNVEVKIGRDRQSTAQVAEMERIRKAGGIYWVSKSFPHFL